MEHIWQAVSLRPIRHHIADGPTIMFGSLHHWSTGRPGDVPRWSITGAVVVSSNVQFGTLLSESRYLCLTRDTLLA